MKNSSRPLNRWDIQQANNLFIKVYPYNNNYNNNYNVTTVALQHRVSTAFVHARRKISSLTCDVTLPSHTAYFHEHVHATTLSLCALTYSLVTSYTCPVVSECCALLLSKRWCLVDWHCDVTHELWLNMKQHCIDNIADNSVDHNKANFHGNDNKCESVNLTDFLYMSSSISFIFRALFPCSCHLVLANVKDRVRRWILFGRFNNFIYI